jgi:hypothetical protein
MVSRLSVRPHAGASSRLSRNWRNRCFAELCPQAGFSGPDFVTLEIKLPDCVEIQTVTATVAEPTLNLKCRAWPRSGG